MPTIQTIANLIVILFGVLLLLAGLLMLFAPAVARSTIGKAGSTNLINYGEITIRLIPAIALILCADTAKLPIAFTLLGWFMAVTSGMLYLIPKRWHHRYSARSAEMLKPGYLRCIAPLAFLFGGLVIYNAT